MKSILYLIFSLTAFSTLPANAQRPIGISSILDSIQVCNPSLKMCDAEVRSLDEVAKGAKSWMAPELSSFFYDALCTKLLEARKRSTRHGSIYQCGTTWFKYSSCVIFNVSHASERNLQ